MALQWAANRAGKAKRQKGGAGNKTKDRASLERSERWAFCFVGKDLLVGQLSRILPVVPENNQLKFLFSRSYSVIQCILLGD